jgi:hypothetical protein
MPPKRLTLNTAESFKPKAESKYSYKLQALSCKRNTNTAEPKAESIYSFKLQAASFKLQALSCKL